RRGPVPRHADARGGAPGAAPIDRPRRDRFRRPARARRRAIRGAAPRVVRSRGAAWRGTPARRRGSRRRCGDCSAVCTPLARRARHIVTENQRVLDAVEALRRGDARRLGVLFGASHASMRDDFETSTPDVDALVRTGAAHPDVYGARLTGGGFGGAVVMIAKAARGRAAGESIPG